MEIAGICDHLKFVVKMHFDNNNAAIVHYASIPMQTSMICDEKRKEKSKVMGISFRSEWIFFQWLVHVCVPLTNSIQLLIPTRLKYCI